MGSGSASDQNQSHTLWIWPVAHVNRANALNIREDPLPAPIHSSCTKPIQKAYNNLEQLPMNTTVTNLSRIINWFTFLEAAPALHSLVRIARRCVQSSHVYGILEGFLHASFLASMIAICTCKEGWQEGRDQLCGPWKLPLVEKVCWDMIWVVY